MMNARSLLLVAVALLPSMFALLSCSREPEPGRAVTVKSAVGSVNIVSGAVKRSPRPGDTLSEGDGIVTGKASSLDLMVGDTTVIRIYENTNTKLSALIGPKNAEGRFNLDNGTIFVIMSKLRKSDAFKVVTPTTTIAVRGTVFRIGAGAEGSSVAVLTGKVEVRAAKDGVEKGIGTVVDKGRMVEMTAARAGQIANGKAEVPVRVLGDTERKTFIGEFLAIKSGVIDALPPATRENFRPDAEEVGALREKALKEARDRALQETIQAKLKAELELREKLKKEAEEKKRKEAEAKAKARQAVQQKRPDRSGDVSGSK